MGVLGRRAQADDVTIGIAFAWILGIGVLLLAVLATSAGGASGITTANTLFGSIYSLSAGAAVIAAVVALAATGSSCGAARPLLLATLDPELAGAARRSRAGAGARASWPRWPSSPPRAPRRSARCCCWA